MRINRGSYLIKLAVFASAFIAYSFSVHAEPQLVTEQEAEAIIKKYEGAVDHDVFVQDKYGHNHHKEISSDHSGHGHDDYHGKKGHGKGHADYAEVDGLPQLKFDTYASQIFWMFVFFIVMYIFFAKKSIPEISSSVEKRRDKIEGDLDNAKDFREQADAAKADYETALIDARNQASSAFTSVEEEIKAEQNQKLEAFKDRSNKLTQSTEAKIEKAKEAAMADTQSIAAEIASIAAQKIVGVSTDLKQAETLVKNITKKAA